MKVKHLKEPVFLLAIDSMILRKQKLGQHRSTSILPRWMLCWKEENVLHQRLLRFQLSCVRLVMQEAHVNMRYQNTQNIIFLQFVSLIFLGFSWGWCCVLGNFARCRNTARAQQITGSRMFCHSELPFKKLYISTSV